MDPDSSASDEIRRFEEQHRRQPESLVFARLADAYRKAGQPERALAVLEDGLIRHPDYPSGHIVRARTLRDLGRIDETLQSFRRVLELDSRNLVAVRELAGLADDKGDVDEARHWYERLAQIDPTNLEARQRVAELASDQSEPAEAVEGSPDPSDTNDWWDDSAVSRKVDVANASPEQGEDATWNEEGESEPAPPDLWAEDVRPPEDEVVEAILNGDVPATVKVEDTWWYEEAPEQEEPEPSRDADLLTRTMADLYAEQGLHREATEIYQELLKDSPGDTDLLERLDALRGKGSEVSEGSLADGDVSEAVVDGEEIAVPEQAPVPLGPPTGPPVVDDLRRLLRIGEERGRTLPDPELPDPEPLAQAERGSGAVDRAEPGDGTAGTSEALAESTGEALSGFARDWIQRLESDA